MISDEQMERAEKEFASARHTSFAKARDAERSLEAATYAPAKNYDPEKRAKLLQAFRDADYEAESRAWILSLIQRARQKSGLPDDAICFFKDGDKTCAVFGDFYDLQSSPAGFGDNFEQAIEDLRNNSKRVKASA